MSSSLVLAARRLLGSGPGPAVSVLLPPLALVLLLRVVIPAIIGDGSWRNAVPERFRMPEVFACILMGQALLPRVLRDQGSCVLYTLPASPLRLHAFHLSALAVVAPGVVGILHAVFVARYPAVGVACAFGAVAACLGYLGRLFVRSQLLCFAGCSAVMLGWWGAASGLALASHIGMWPEVWAGTPLQDHAWPACVAAMLTALLAVVALNGSTLLELSDTRRRRAFAIVCACLLVGGTSLMLLTPHDVAILLARGGN